MGSYLSIVNNTSDEWLCHVGPDKVALSIAGVVVAVLGAVVAVIATAGAAAPLAAAVTANGALTVLGVSSGALASITAGAAAISGVATAVGAASDFSITMARGVANNLIEQGYHPIAPGDKHRWGKMTLSLWQQGTCVRTSIIDERIVRTETLYMRPIFSGALADSNNDHDIQWWINNSDLQIKDAIANQYELKKKESRMLDDGDADADAARVIEYHADNHNATDLSDLHVGDTVLIYA